MLSLSDLFPRLTLAALEYLATHLDQLRCIPETVPTPGKLRTNIDTDACPRQGTTLKELHVDSIE